MSTSLFSALSSLKAHQGWIDMIGNNLANTNTPGFKGSRMTFADSLSRTLRYASGPLSGLGGRNPNQIGSGVKVADIARNFTQGALTQTGRTFDMAIEGLGFFALTNGTGNVYSRVGTFGLDAASNLVDLRTGYRVLNPTGSAVTLDVASPFQPKPTGAIELTGNLPAEVTGPLPEVLTGNTGLRHGNSAMLVGTASDPLPTIPNGETWTMSVAVDGGAAQLVQIAGTGVPVTVAEIAAAVDALDGVSATVDGNGFVQITTDRTGDAVSLQITPGAVGQDLAAAAGLSTTLVTGSEQDLIPGVTTLNDLPGNATDYADGDLIRISGVDTDGSPVNATFRYGAANDGETVDAFITFIDGLFADASVSLNDTGQILVEAQTAGEADLVLSISEEPGQTGVTEWSTYATSVTTDGTGPDTVVTSTEAYDAAGIAHTLTLTFERQADLTWTVTPSMEAADGVVLSDPITGLQFGDDGLPTGLGAVDATIRVQYAGQSAAQTVQVDLGADGQVEGLTQFGSDLDVWVSDQDGYGVGELAGISVGQDGVIGGFYTNGQERTLGAVGVATFSNPEGLTQVGDNFFVASPNSGQVQLGAGLSGAAGRVEGGALENSNVDTAEQFVHLIEAQRGFQANARVITTQDEVLAETVNLV